MNTSKNTSYETVCDFFEGKNDFTDELNKLITENPAYGIFHETEQLTLDVSILKHIPNFNFYLAEKYLEDYFCGNMTANQALHIKSAILNSEKAFRILMYKIKLHRIVPGQSENINTKSEEDLFKIIKETKNVSKVTNKASTLTSFLKPRFSVAAILTTAAAFLILFLLPLQKKTDLLDIYNFDERVPLDYYNSGLRGSGDMETVTDPELRPYINIFKDGMAEYLANDYLKAIEKWRPLEEKIPLIEAKDSTGMDNFVLYYALSHLSLATTQKELSLLMSRKQYLDKSIELMEKIEIRNDRQKYYYALSLVLDGQKEKAVNILSTIKEGSEFEEQSDVLMEQINL